MAKTKLKQNEVEFWEVWSGDEEYQIKDAPDWVWESVDFGYGDDYKPIEFDKWGVRLHIPSWIGNGIVEVPNGDYIVKGCGGYILPVSKEDFPKFFEEMND